MFALLGNIVGQAAEEKQVIKKLNGGNHQQQGKYDHTPTHKHGNEDNAGIKRSMDDLCDKKSRPAQRDGNSCYQSGLLLGNSVFVTAFVDNGYHLVVAIIGS